MAGHGVPPDSIKLTAPDGRTFWAPRWADFKLMYSTARDDADEDLSVKERDIRTYIAQGGIYDLQRSGDTFYPAYTDAANYAVGVFMRGLGFSWTETASLGVIYAIAASKQGPTALMMGWWRNGYNAAAQGQLYSPDWYNF